MMRFARSKNKQCNRSDYLPVFRTYRFYTNRIFDQWRSPCIDTCRHRRRTGIFSLLGRTFRISYRQNHTRTICKMENYKNRDRKNRNDFREILYGTNILPCKNRIDFFPNPPNRNNKECILWFLCVPTNSTRTFDSALLACREDKRIFPFPNRKRDPEPYILDILNNRLLKIRNDWVNTNRILIHRFQVCTYIVPFRHRMMEK